MKTNEDQNKLESKNIIKRSTFLHIDNNEKFKKATNFLFDLKKFIKKINENYRPLIKKANDAHKAIIATEKNQLSPFKEAEKIIKSKLLQYRIDQEKIKKNEEERIQRELKQQMETELLQKAEETGNEEFLNKEIVVPKVEVEVIPKQKGLSFIEKWTFKITDRLIIPEQYKIIDMQKIKKVVQALKNETNIPGIEIYKIHEVRGATQ
jgi:hypothetical protein